MLENNYSVQDILDAYKKTGLTPRKNTYYGAYRNSDCGCALTALYCAENNLLTKEDRQSILHLDIVVYNWEKQTLGSDGLHLRDGFDGCGNNYTMPMWKVGREASKILFNNGGSMAT